MIRKILYIVVLGPIALFIIAFCVANRKLVDVSFDPLGGSDPALTIELPLFILILVSILVGILAGGFAAWLRQDKWRRTARANAHAAARWQNEAQDMRQRLEDSAPRALPGVSVDSPLP